MFRMLERQLNLVLFCSSSSQILGRILKHKRLSFRQLAWIPVREY